MQDPTITKVVINEKEDGLVWHLSCGHVYPTGIGNGFTPKTFLDFCKVLVGDTLQCPNCQKGESDE